MTCIVGVIEKEKVWLGGDSAISNSQVVTILKSTKVFKKGPFIIGCEGSFRMLQLLKYDLVIPKLTNKDIEKYLCTEFAENIKNLVKDKLSDHEGSKFGSFLIGYKNRLFEFDEDLQVIETLNGVNSIGGRRRLCPWIPLHFNRAACKCQSYEGIGSLGTVF
jgi:hypothetical protein